MKCCRKQPAAGGESCVTEFVFIWRKNSVLLTVKRGITKMIDSLALAGADRKQQSRGGHRKNGKNDIG